MALVTSPSGRGPMMGTKKKQRNAAVDNPTNPAPYLRSPSLVVAIHGTSISSTYTDWYAQTQRGSNPIARSRADTGSMRAGNTSTRCRTKYGTQKNIVNASVSAAFILQWVRARVAMKAAPRLTPQTPRVWILRGVPRQIERTREWCEMESSLLRPPPRTPAATARRRQSMRRRGP